jgi:hypothetical protein
MAVACAAALWACTERSQPAAVGIPGTHDLALVGDLLFVTATDRSELRAFDLSATPVRDFVRAPNPIEPLSIPVVERPIDLAKDIAFVDGAVWSGPYVYVRAASGQQLSVVGAERESLVELQRLTVPGTITAMAARGPGEGEGSTLYLATFDGRDGHLWRASLPSPQAIAGWSPALEIVTSTPAEAIVALLVLPAAHEVALATRAQVGAGGRTWILDLQTLAARELAFGAPIRALHTHAAFSDVAAGARIFGLLDEAACGVLTFCRGVVGVEASAGGRLADAAGAPLPPVDVGPALITGLDVSPPGAKGPLLPTADGDKVWAGSSLVGALSASDGLVYLFDAEAAGHFDLSSSEGLQPAFVRIKPGALAARNARLDVPGTPVLAPEVDRLYVSFPSGNVLVEFNPETVPLGREVEQGFQIFR